MKIKLLLLLTFFVSAFSWGQTPFNMSSGNYSEDFSDIANTTNWPNGFNGPSSTEFRGFVNNTGTVPSANVITTNTTSFSGGTTGGVQRGIGNILLLSTGGTDNTSSAAIDLYLNFSDRTAGTLSFDAATVFNSAGNRNGSLKVYATIDGVNFSELTGTNLPYVATNNVASNASITSIALPSNFSDSATARLRFYYHNGSGGSSGSRPKISIDNILVTSTPITTNDTDSEIDGPILAGQPDPVLVSSLIDTDAEAIHVFNFDVYDYGTDDGEPTKITQVTIKPGSNNTANWANTIGGVKLSLDGGTTFVTTGTPTITAGSIVIPITSGNLNIPDNDALTVSMFMYLRNSGLVDNSILEFSIPSTTHGFTTHSSGSAFAATFPSTTVSNEMLIDVVRTRLTITTQPTTTACPFSNLDTAAVFSATDANGNVDRDFTGLVTVTNSGSILMSGNSVNAVAGVATFTNLQFQNTGNVTLTASATGITNSAATNAIAISVANVTAAAATNGNASSVISWTNPACRDEILIVVKANSAVTTSPSGNGTAYTGNLNFGSGTAFDDGYVVYKGNASPQTLLNLTNGTTYHITFFTRRGTSWSSGVTITCTPNLSSTANSYFRSRNTGSWNSATTWQSSPDNITWINSTLVPTLAAAQIEIMNSHVVTINSSGVSMTNTFVRNGGTLEITTASAFTLDGDDEIELTVDNGGVFLVNSPGSFSAPNNYQFGLIKTGGKLVAGPNMTNGGTAFSNAYLGRLNGLFYFENQAICEWDNANTVLGSSSPTDSDFFFPYNVGDMPIFRISTTPAFSFGSASDNVFYAILEANADFFLRNGGTKTFHGGIRGTALVSQDSSSGNLILGNGTNIPELGGTVTIRVISDKIKLPNGANVTPGSNVIIERNGGTVNGIIDRQGGILNINADGILDITNMRITNTASGSVTVNGTLRTSNPGGLYGPGSAIVTGDLNLNNNSTIDYYATLDQAISSIPNYYNITFSGAGTKTPQNAISVNTNGTVRITGTPTVNFMLNNLASTGTNNTAFIMDGGRLRLGTTGTQPNMQGDYTLTGGIVEFANNSISGQSIRSPKSYQNIEVTGSYVDNSGGIASTPSPISLNNNGTFTITGTGKFTSSNGFNPIDGGSSGNQTLTIRTGGNFVTAVTPGFYGIASSQPYQSVQNSIENIVLESGSFVEYGRKAGVGSLGLPFDASSGDQTITHHNFGTTLNPYSYQNLNISGNGNKTLLHNTATRVNENLQVLSGNTATLLVEEGKVITVKQAVKLPSAAGDAKLEIKNNGQLIQIDNLPLANTGTNFIMERIAKVNREDYVYWSSPSDAFSTATIPSTGSRYEWDPLKVNSNGTQGNWVTPTTTMTKGKGYIAKVPNTAAVRPSVASDLTTNFTGKPHNGTFTVDIFRGNRTTAGSNVTEYDDNWNLVGNPYPSAISALKFLETNGGNLVDMDFPTPAPTITGAIWVWRHGQTPNNSIDPFYYNFANNYYSSDYIKFNALGSTPVGAFDGYIASGQGFMVNMKDNTSDVPHSFTPTPTNPIHNGYRNTIIFNNSMRYDNSEVHHSNNQFFRTNNSQNNVVGEDEKHRIWLDIINTPTGQTDMALIGYATNATLGEDNLYDAFFVPRGEVSLYSLIDTKSYIIQGRPLPFDTNDLVPLGMKIISAGNHTIAIRQVDGLFEGNQNIYLEDKQLNIIHDLKQNPYHFTSPTGVFNDRFILRYTTSALGNADFDYDNQVVVFSKNSTISINSSIQNIEEVQVYDVLGRTLYQNKSIDNQMHSFTKDIATQTIIVKVKLQNGIWITKKVLLK